LSWKSNSETRNDDISEAFIASGDRVETFSRDTWSARRQPFISRAAAITGNRCVNRDAPSRYREVYLSSRLRGSIDERSKRKRKLIYGRYKFTKQAGKR